MQEDDHWYSNKFIQAASFEHKESFFEFTEDGLDTYLGLYLVNESQFIIILSQGQSSVEQGFSVNKEFLQDNPRNVSDLAKIRVSYTAKQQYQTLGIYYH